MAPLPIQHQIDPARLFALRTQPPPPLADITPMEDALALFDLSEDHIVLELHEALTWPGPALELHVAVGPRGTEAWWMDEQGRWMGDVAVRVG